jgi:hypothetical protein
LPDWFESPLSYSMISPLIVYSNLRRSYNGAMYRTPLQDCSCHPLEGSDSQRFSSPYPGITLMGRKKHILALSLGKVTR